MPDDQEDKKTEAEEESVTTPGTPEAVEFDDDEVAEHQAEREERESEADAKDQDRTARFDPILKERAKVVGVNPHNFSGKDAENELGKAVAKAEEEQNINQAGNTTNEEV